MLRRIEASDLASVIDAWDALYEGDPSWVPPLWAWARPGLTKALARPRHFSMVAFKRHGRICATASLQRDGPSESRAALAWLGHFEATDAEAAHRVLQWVSDTALSWGVSTIRGPRNLSRFEFVGLGIDGFDRLPPMLQGHHKPAYAQCLLDAGYTPHHDHLAYETPLVDASGRPRDLPEALASKVAACTVDVRFRRARRRHLDRDLHTAHAVLNEAYATVPDVSPMPRGQFLAITRAVLALGHPELIQLGELDGVPVAFAVCLPEVNEALVACRGRLWPTGWGRLLRAWPGIHTAAFKLIGVVPRLRGTGTHAALIAAVVRGAQAAGFTRMDGSIIDERNAPMRGVVEGIGMDIYRRYRVYERKL